MRVVEQGKSEISGYYSVPREIVRQLGAMAFVAIILFLAFYPSPISESVYTTIAPLTAVRHAREYLKQMGFSAESLGHWSIFSEQWLTDRDLSGLEMECRDRAFTDVIGRIVDVVPPYLYRIEFGDASVWVRPDGGRIFALRLSDGDTILDRDAALVIARRRMALSGLSSTGFRLFRAAKTEDGRGWNFEWHKPLSCGDGALVVAVSVDGVSASGPFTKLERTGKQGPRRRAIWSMLTLTLPIVMLLVLMVIVIWQVKKIGLGFSAVIGSSLYPLIILTAVEFLAEINRVLVIGHITSAMIVGFVSRIGLLGIVLAFSWTLLRNELGSIIPREKLTREIYIRDGLISGILVGVIFLGLIVFMNSIGITVGLPLSITKLGIPPFYSGAFPSVGSILWWARSSLVLFPLLFVSIFFFNRHYGNGIVFKLIFFAGVFIWSLWGSETPSIFLVTLVGNLIMGLFAYFIVFRYVRINIVAYIVAIATYLFLGDGYLYIARTLSLFLVANGIFLLSIVVLIFFLFLHLCFFAELRKQVRRIVEKTPPIRQIVKKK